jgi:hypothetical protein
LKPGVWGPGGGFEATQEGATLEAAPQGEATEQPLRNLKSWTITADPPADANLEWTDQQRAAWLTAKEMGRRGHRELAEAIRMAMTSDPPLWRQEYRTSSD